MGGGLKLTALGRSELIDWNKSKYAKRLLHSGAMSMFLAVKRALFKLVRRGCLFFNSHLWAQKGDIGS